MTLKQINNYPKYTINEWGEVFSSCHKNVRKLRPQFGQGEHPFVCLYDGTSYRRIRIHRLVAEHFLDTWTTDLEVNHIDGNKQNNHVSNLEMCTRSDNMKHAYRLGLQKPQPGVKHGMAKLNQHEVDFIRLYCVHISNVDIGIMFGVSSTPAYRVKNNICYKQ